MGKYAKWIKEETGHLTQAQLMGRCKEYSEKMLLAFPELVLTRGHYICSVWGDREHWWLSTEEGDVIDPTAYQFPSKGCGYYIPVDENAPEPIGMCMDCGDYCYENPNFCSESCEGSYMSYINGGPL